MVKRGQNSVYVVIEWPLRKKFDLENFSKQGLRSKFQMMGANHKLMTQIHLKKSNFLVS